MKLVIHNGSRVWGGNEKWLTTLAVGLRERGHEVVVSCRRGGPVQERLEREGVRTSPTRPGGELDLPSHLRFARWLRRERPDTLLLTSWNRTPSAVRAARRARVPRVVARLGIVRALPPRGRYTRAFRRGVDALIVNSSEIRQEWLSSAPWFPPDAVHVVLNGLRLPVPASAEENAAGVASPRAAAIRRELGLPADVRLIAGAGHVTPRKGFDLLLRALAVMRAPEVHAAIFGSGPEEPALRALAGELGVAERVHWPGFRPNLVALLPACDVFALTSRNEGMANVMLEAMAAGVPVVATDISGVRDAIGAVRGRPAAGWIVPPDDPVALGGTLNEVIAALESDPGAVRAATEEARARIRSWFSVERMVEEAERVLFPEPVR
jgi:glycosyltransferase involved in cell wall biosynthesis